MTSKKRRQRGSRTHGGGSHKNRRGAGNRGGRGGAGRAKHEFHNYPPLGKHGFDRPQKLQEDILTVNIREIDENITLYAAKGLAEERNGSYRIDVRDVVDGSDDADAVKILGGGQVRHRLEVITDDCSSPAREAIEEEGGKILLSDQAQQYMKESNGDPSEDDSLDNYKSSEENTVEIVVNEDSLSGQIEQVSEELNFSEKEEEEFRRFLFDIIRSEEERRDARLSDSTRNQIANLLASVWRQEYPQLKEILKDHGEK